MRYFLALARRQPHPLDSVRNIVLVLRRRGRIGSHISLADVCRRSSSSCVRVLAQEDHRVWRKDTPEAARICQAYPSSIQHASHTTVFAPTVPVCTQQSHTPCPHPRHLVFVNTKIHAARPSSTHRSGDRGCWGSHICQLQVRRCAIL